VGRKKFSVKKNPNVRFDKKGGGGWLGKAKTWGKKGGHTPGEGRASEKPGLRRGAPNSVTDDGGKARVPRGGGKHSRQRGKKKKNRENH